MCIRDSYFTDKKRQQKTKLALLQKLEDYRTWLHQITIIDPACGSGAFPVSYTHLDVYKRQSQPKMGSFCDAFSQS